MASALRKGPIGLLIGLAIVSYCVYAIGPAKILLALRQVNTSLLLLGLFLILLWLLLGALNIRTMLAPLAKIPYTTVLAAYSNANMAALIMPGQVGDLVIVKFFKEMNIPLTQGVTLFATDKLVTLGWYVAFALYGLHLAGSGLALDLANIDLSSYLIPALAIIALFGLTLALFFREPFHLVPKRVRNWFALARSYLSIARKAILLNVLITLARIMVMGGAYWVTIRAYGPAPTFLQALCFAIAAGLVAYIPLSFNGLGTVEAALISLYSTINIASAPVLSAALSMRLLLIAVVAGCAMSAASLRRRGTKEDSQ